MAVHYIQTALWLWLTYLNTLQTSIQPLSTGLGLDNLSCGWLSCRLEFPLLGACYRGQLYRLGLAGFSRVPGSAGLVGQVWLGLVWVLKVMDRASYGTQW